MFWKPSLKARLERARTQLLNIDYATHDKGLTEVGDLLNADLDPLKVIELATHKYPCDDVFTHQSTSKQLLRLLWGCRAPGFVAALEAAYDSFEDKVRAREEALVILMRLQTEEGYRATVRLLARPSSHTVGMLDGILGVSLAERPREALCMFPGLFEVIPNLHGRGDVYQVILSYVAAGLLNLEEHPTFAHYCLDRTASILENECLGRDLEDSAENAQRHHLAAVEIEYLLDVVKSLKDPRVEPLLRRALTQKPFFDALGERESRRMRMFAATTLLSRGATVDPAFFDEVAENPGNRWRLWQQLSNVDRLDAFPLRYRSQQQLAEAELVMWLEHPMEMGRPPEAIHSVGVFHFTDVEGVRQAMYLFRYRYADFSNGRRQVGVAGPYAADQPPQIGGPRTFSLSPEWESKSLEEHVRDYLPDDATDLEIRAVFNPALG